MQTQWFSNESAESANETVWKPCIWVVLGKRAKYIFPNFTDFFDYCLLAVRCYDIRAVCESQDYRNVLGPKSGEAACAA